MSKGCHRRCPILEEYIENIQNIQNVAHMRRRNKAKTHLPWLPFLDDRQILDDVYAH